MVDEDAEHPLEVATVEDQEPIEALRSDGADEAFGDRVRLRRSHRCADDLDSFASEDRVEIARELAVAIPDQEANRSRALDQSPGELSGLLRDPDAGGIGRTAGEPDAPAAVGDEEEHVEAAEPERLDG